jgi:hypothetical protein
MSAPTTSDGQEDESMTRQMKRARTLVTLGILILGTLATTATHAFAMVDYKIWYFDDNADWFQEGDVSVAGVKLIPPAWACTLRFYSPSYYRWVDTNENTLPEPEGSADFYQDVRVHLPRPGCPETEVVIKLLDGTIIPHPTEPIGASYMRIYTHGAITWLDAGGSNHACGFACVAPVGLTYFTLKSTVSVVIDAIGDVQGTMFDPGRQSRVLDAVGGLRNRLRALDAGIRRQITVRRQYNLGDREASVRALEDAALRKLTESDKKLLECESRVREWRFPDAFVAGEFGSDFVGAMQSLLRVAESSFPPRKP